MNKELFLQLALHFGFLAIELFLAGYIYEQAKKLKEDKENFLDAKRSLSSAEYNYRKRIQEEFQEQKKSLIQKIKEYLANGKDISEV